jgi:hypothetical protein
MNENDINLDEVVVDDIVEQKDDEGNDTTDWKALALKNQGIAKRLKTKMSKSKETKTETTETKPEESKNGLLEKAFLRSAGITDKEEVELALLTAKKWDVDIDALVDDEDFQEKLEKHRTKKANLEATSDIKGDRSGTSAKNTPEYWVAKGTPPTADQVPDRKTRVKIARAMISNTKSGKKFYND